MASENEAAMRTRKKENTQEEEEDLVHDTLRDSLGRIQSDILKLERAIDFNENNPRKLAILLNAKRIENMEGRKGWRESCDDERRASKTKHTESS